MTNQHPYHDSIAIKQTQDHAAWLARAKVLAIQISLERGFVSSDDIWNGAPPPDNADPRVMGALWRPRKDWLPVGYIPSTRRECHYRPIRQWTYVGKDAERAEAAE